MLLRVVQCALPGAWEWGQEQLFRGSGKWHSKCHPFRILLSWIALGTCGHVINSICASHFLKRSLVMVGGVTHGGLGSSQQGRRVFSLTRVSQVPWNLAGREPEDLNMLMLCYWPRGAKETTVHLCESVNKLDHSCAYVWYLHKKFVRNKEVMSAKHLSEGLIGCCCCYC